ncbi:type I secretion system permease/ATPase, partial [Verminephrobacter sp. Larva24]
QRQRIGLARALYGDPALLVFDEPNAHLDEIGEAALLTAISGLKARGKTILMVTHRAGVLAQADQVLVMRAGRIHLQGPRDQVFAQMNAEREDDPPPAANGLPALLPA